MLVEDGGYGAASSPSVAEIYKGRRKKIMTVEVVGRVVNYGAPVYIGAQWDNNVFDIVFNGLPALHTDQTAALHWFFKNDDESMVGDIIPLTNTGEGWDCVITNSITQFAGKVLTAHVNVSYGEQNWNSSEFPLSLTEVTKIDETVLPFTPTLLDDAMTRMAGHSLLMKEQLEAAEGLADECGQILVETTTLAVEVSDSAQGIEADKDATHGFMVRSENAAQRAGDSADAATNNLLNGVSTHDASTGAHEDIREDARRIEAIARGRATAHVFDTYAGMLAWVANPTNVAELVRGDNLYIRDIGVKDYWWDGNAVQELEAEAPDLTNYYTKAQVDAKLPVYLSESAYAALVAGGTVEAGRVYFTIPDEYWEG